MRMDGSVASRAALGDIHGFAHTGKLGGVLAQAQRGQHSLRRDEMRARGSLLQIAQLEQAQADGLNSHLGQCVHAQCDGCLVVGALPGGGIVVVGEGAVAKGKAPSLAVSSSGRTITGGWRVEKNTTTGRSIR